MDLSILTNQRLGCNFFGIAVMADDETCEPTLDILQPEVMSKADLVTLLRKVK